MMLDVMWKECVWFWFLFNFYFYFVYLYEKGYDRMLVLCIECLKVVYGIFMIKLILNVRKVYLI